LCASFILFKGFNTTEPVNTLSLICGFLVTFTGVYLLNLSRTDPNGTKMLARRSNGDATGTDMISSIQTRMSMEARRSQGHRISSGGGGDRDGLIRAYDEEEATGFGLTDLAEDTDEDDDPRSPMIPSFPRSNGNGNGNGHPPNGNRLSVKNANESIELQNRKSGDRR
jgi:hypothetical protein